MKHTPGKIEFDGEAYLFAKHAEQGDLMLAELRGAGWGAPIVANGKRLAACWNACEGINPETVPDLLAMLKLVEYSFSSRERFTQHAILVRNIIARAETK